MVNHSMDVSSDTASLSHDEEENEDDEEFRFGINCPEKIVFIIDVNPEMGRTYFRSDQEDNRTNLDWMKKGIQMFLKTKSMLNSKHEYAIIALQEDAPFYLQEATSDINVLNETLRDVVTSESEETAKKLHLDPVLELINTPSLRQRSDGPKSVADGVVRAIFIYCRPPECRLVVSKSRKVWNSLQNLPRFFFDSISFCEESGQDNENFQWLQHLDENNKNYNLNIWRNEAQIFETFAKLLAHPLQRTRQDNARYRVVLET